jgi:hypothetical protein
MTMSINRYGVSVVVAIALLAPLSTHAQWSGPSQAPTGSNVSAPLNVGSSAQVKNGGLSVNAFTAWLNAYFAQNVGIGVVSPSYKLSVEGILGPGTNVRGDGGYGGIDFSNNGIGYQYSAKIFTFKAGSSEYYGLTNDYGSGAGAQLSIVSKETGSNSGNIGFFTGNGDNTADMVIAASGNVGIGATSPGAKLEVAGQVKITGGTPGAGKVLTSDAAGLATWTTPSAGNPGTVTSISTGAGLSGGPITSSGTITNTGVISNSCSGGISCSGTNPSTFTNTGVTSIVAGSDISISGATGAVTINAASSAEADTLATVTSRGATTNTALGFNGNISVGANTRVAINGGGISSGGVYGFGNGAAYSNLNSVAVDTLETDGGVGGGGTLELNYYGGVDPNLFGRLFFMTVLLVTTLIQHRLHT